METRIGNECECGENREIEESPGIWVCVACGTRAAGVVSTGSTTFEEIEGEPPSTYYVIRETKGERRYLHSRDWVVEADLATQFPTIESARVARGWLSGSYQIWVMTVTSEVVE